MENFYEQLRNVCKEHNTSIYALEKATGASKGSFIKWRNSSPSADKLVEIADLLEVSMDDLIGRTIPQTKKAVPMERPETALTTEMPDLFEEQRFIDMAKIYNELPDEYRERACNLILGIAIGIGLNVDKVLGR